MKNILKHIAVPALAALVLSACAAKEKLDLAGYPETEMELNISDLTEASPLLELTALYNSAGDLTLDGALTHAYLIKLTKASPQDLTLRLQPIAVNIPAEKVILSQTEYTIPAGEVELPVTVTFTDADFNFAAHHKDAQTYEIGVRVVDARGGATDAAKMIGTEAKVVVNKEIYSAGISVADAEGRTKNFSRTMWDGAINETLPMTYDFKVYLNRPASADINITFSLESLAAEFAGDWSVTPSTVVIPAGSVVSETAAFSLNNDFLTTTTGAEDRTLTLTAHHESADGYTAMAEGKEAITINVAKTIDGLNILPASLPSGWTKLPSAGWTLSHTNLFDGSTTGSSYVTLSRNVTTSVTADMKEIKTLKGFIIRPYSGSTYNCQTVEIFVSNDGVDYASIGRKTVTTLPAYHVFELKSSVLTQYLKFDLLRTTTGTCRIAEVEVY